MTRSEVRQKLEMAWWRQLGLTLAPLLVVCVFFGSSEPLIPVLGIPLFIAG
ncbi:MFS transporter, partial [Pseudomonas syringae pv. actinidiae]|nr:MFS transporter [Pseudomonas syringae pv. actinidiae]